MYSIKRINISISVKWRHINNKYVQTITHLILKEFCLKLINLCAHYIICLICMLRSLIKDLRYIICHIFHNISYFCKFHLHFHYKFLLLNRVYQSSMNFIDLPQRNSIKVKEFVLHVWITNTHSNRRILLSLNLHYDNCKVMVSLLLHLMPFIYMEPCIGRKNSTAITKQSN